MSEGMRSTGSGLGSAVEAVWRELEAGRADVMEKRHMIDTTAIRDLRRRVAEHQRTMQTADRTSVGDLLILMSQTGFLSAGVPYLLDEIERLRARLHAATDAARATTS